MDQNEEKVFEGVQDLCEARLIRSKQALSSYNAKDIADLTFLYFIALTILKKDFSTASIAAGYAKHTMRFGNWDGWRFSYNDLGMLIHTLFGKNNQVDKLKDANANQMFMKKIRLNDQEVKNWLRDTARGIDRTNRDRRFMLNLEKNLGIDNSNYRSMRRLAPEWQTLSHGERSLVMTRLLQAFRIRARKSELFKVLETMAKANKLEIKNAKNPEDAYKEKTSLMKKAAMAAGLSLGAVGLGAAHGAWKAKKKDQARNWKVREEEEADLELDEVYETSSAGSTSAGGIASVAAPGGYVRRTPTPDYQRLRKNDKNKKDYGMAITSDPMLTNGEKDQKARQAKKTSK